MNLINRKYTRLEKNLLLIVTIIVAGSLLYLLVQILGKFPENRDEAGLRKKFEKFAEVVQNHDDAYFYDNILSKSEKKVSREQFLIDASKRAGQQQGTVKTIQTADKITIDGDVGYVLVDGINCKDVACDQKTEWHVYRKWVYEDNVWHITITNDHPYCIRDNPYPMPPEFSRALSLIKQRLTQKYGTGKYWNDSLINCVEIQYSNLGNDTEGLFTFDSNNSSPEKLSILVDRSFQAKDDILTAYLLDHEMDHVNNYYLKYFNNMKISCYDDEIYAFESQLVFIGSLNSGELDSLVSRIYLMNTNDPTLSSIKLMANDFSGNAISRCGRNASTCYTNTMNDQISNMVMSSPYYQKQCSTR